MSTAVEYKLTDENLLSTLREVVAERPEYVYSSPGYMEPTEDGGTCFYVHKDEDGSLVSAGCAVGAVLHRLGVPLEELVKYEGKPALNLLRDIAPTTSSLSRIVLNHVQMYQDDGEPWGMAYVKATGETI